MNLAARCPQDMRPGVRVLCGHLTIMTACSDHTCEMDQSGDLVSRKAESLVTEALADTRHNLPGPAQGVRQDHLQMDVPGYRWVFTAVVPHDQG